MRGVPTRLNGTTLVIRIPMRFQRRGGRKRIVAPDGSAIVLGAQAPAGRHPEGLGMRAPLQQMLEKSEYGTLAELASAERISSGAVPGVHREGPAPGASALRARWRADGAEGACRPLGVGRCGRS